MADCGWCGEFMYEGRRIDFYDTCGSRECEREARDSQRADLEDARAAAELDDYARYR